VNVLTISIQYLIDKARSIANLINVHNSLLTCVMSFQLFDVSEVPSKISEKALFFGQHFVTSKLAFYPRSASTVAPLLLR